MTPLLLSDVTSRRFWRELVGTALATVGLVATLAGLFDVLFPNDLPKIGTPAAIGILVVAAATGLSRAWPRPVQETFTSPSLRIKVLPGDLLEQSCHLMIGMCDTFDTARDIIATTSLQAQFLRRFLGGDVSRFDSELVRGLAGFSPIATIAKAGKTDQYQLGTVATLGGVDRRFFCVAYTEMNERNEARGTIDGVWSSLTSLWSAVCEFGNGSPVAMPAIGGGQSRLSQSLSPADAIRLQVMSFWLASREERLSEELRIVVPPDVYDKLDRRELQEFLSSLKPS